MRRTVSKVESKPWSRRPSAPFTTSTLQQEAGRKLRLSARDTMRVAQSLYENGYITYMRTDSVSLSQQAINAARTQATTLYGADSVPDKPRVYAGKSKNAQEAHEAIRPSGEVFRTPSELQSVLRGSESSPLRPHLEAHGRLADGRREGPDRHGHDRGRSDATDASAPEGATAPVADTIAEFTASGTVITFPGFRSAYEESRDEERNADDASGEAKLPPLTEGQQIGSTSSRPRATRRPRCRATPRRAS